MLEIDLIPAAAYIRMSSDMQDMSPERQRMELENFAQKRGYRIIRWYCDLGVSGSRDESARVEFQRMLLDSAKGDFKAVLCVNVKRFGRQDSQHSAAPKLILRMNGVYL